MYKRDENNASIKVGSIILRIAHELHPFIQIYGHIGF